MTIVHIIDCCGWINFIKLKMLLIIISMLCSVQVGQGIIDITNQIANTEMIIGNNVTLVCKVLPLVNAITLATARYPLPADRSTCLSNIDQCIPDVTSSNSDITFSSNISIGEFYINIIHLSWQDGTNYTCRHGSSETITKNIAIAGQIPNGNLTIDEQNGGALKLNTGCVFPVDNVTVILYYTQVNGTLSGEYTPDNYSTDVENSSGCSGDASQKIIQFTIPEVTDGYITVTIHANITHSVTGQTWKAQASTNYKISITTTSRSGKVGGSTTAIAVGTTVSAAVLCFCTICGIFCCHTYGYCRCCTRKEPESYNDLKKEIIKGKMASFISQCAVTLGGIWCFCCSKYKYCTCCKRSRKVYPGNAITRLVLSTGNKDTSTSDNKVNNSKRGDDKYIEKNEKDRTQTENASYFEEENGNTTMDFRSQLSLTDKHVRNNQLLGDNTKGDIMLIKTKRKKKKRKKKEQIDINSDLT